MQYKRTMLLNNALRLFIIAMIGTVVISAKSKKAFTAQVVEDIVQQEIAKKMPAAAGVGHSKKKSLTGVHLKEATDAINKLVDESIVDRVQEAEKEVSQMLLKSIEHHIQDAGKVLLKQDENTCRDKLDACDKLAESGVCESSKDAMVINCPMTCNFCGMLEDLKNQAKAEESKEQKVSEPVKSKKKVKHRKIKKHKKKHRKIAVKNANLAPEEVRLIHENMLDQAIDHANLPMATTAGGASDQGTNYDSSAEQHQNVEAREYEADQQSAAIEEEKEEKEKEQEEIMAEEREREREREQEREHEHEMFELKRKKSAARKQKLSDQSKGNYLPPNPAGQDLNVQNMQNIPSFQVPQGVQNIQAVAMQVPSTMTGATIATKRNDFTETDNQKKVTDKTIINKLIKVDLKNSKKKTDVKLKKEIETMVDKAFGELLL